MMILIYVLVILLTFGGGGFAGYQHGKKIERAEWQEKEAKQRDELAKELAAAIARKSAHESAQQTNLMKVINEKDNTINQLNHDLASANRLRITTKSATCPENTLRGEAKGASKPTESTSDATVRIAGGVRQEIQSTDEIINREIWRVYEEKERLKAYAKALRAELEPLVEVVD